MTAAAMPAAAFVASVETPAETAPPAAAPLAAPAVVANLRRLRREVCRGCYRTQVRRIAVQAAYDDTLLECCRIVDIDAPLATADAEDRPFARLLTEAALENAGIALDPP
jgi:hypothetical protein